MIRASRMRRYGRVDPGFLADLTVLGGNPEHDIRALAVVRITVRSGRVVYEESDTIGRGMGRP